AEREVQLGLISRIGSLFRFRFEKPETQSPSEFEASAAGMEPEIKQAPPSLPAHTILVEIGLQLRERRESISLTLDEVERHTKLRAVFVKALEEGAMDKLPSTVQTRGMLANYATFLNLDTDAILLRFADYLQTRRYEKYAETPRENIQTQVVTSMPLLRSFIAGDLIFGLLMIAILAALAIWGVGRLITTPNQDSEAAPSIIDVLGATPLQTPTVDVTLVPLNDGSLATSAEASGLTSLDAPTSSVDANVVVSIFAVERVFVRVSVDGKIAFEGRLAPRETKLFEADDQVVVLTGNAAALRITYNGRDLGLMGTIGEVVNRVYLISGVVTPTATLPPTATNTPLITSTPTPAISPTRTALPTAGG
ncbi:MAG TPA: RodZ domain-containing protein, partial [Anaerolineales bacterium]|nr:RodZ domain-containing protein [Anaerolineales bacterium]